jgi:hypothetical protein
MAPSTPPFRPMDIQHLASVETHALADRLLQEHTAVSLRQIRLLRDALDTATAAVSTPGNTEPLLTAFTDRLLDAINSEIARVRDDAAAALQAVQVELDEERAARTRLAAAVDAADEEVAALRAGHARLAQETEAALTVAAEAEQRAAAQIQEQLARVEQLTAALADAERRVAEEIAAAAAERARLDAAERDAHTRTIEAEAREAVYRAECERLEASLADVERREAALTDEAQAARARIEALDQDLAVTIDAHAEVEADRKEARAEIRRASQTHAALEADLTDARSALERTEGEAAELRQELGRQGEAVAVLERRLTDALDAGADRDTLLAEIETRRACIEALEGAAAERDAHTRVLESRLEAAARAEAQILEDLAARELALERERADARDARERLDALASEHASVAARLLALEAEHTATTAGLQALDTEHAMVLTRLQALDADHATASARIRSLEADLAGALEAGAERERLATRLAEREARISALEADLAAAAAAGSARDALTTDLQARTARIDDLETRLAEMRASADADRDAIRHDVDRMAALFDASARALTEMAQASNSTDLLTGLVKRLALQFSRVALFRVKGDRLVGEQQVGLDAIDVESCTLATTGESLPARAFRSGGLVVASGPEAQHTGLPSSGVNHAISLPITLHNVPIAIVYADDADMPEAARSAAMQETGLAFAELLAGQVIALLVRHTHELKTLAELRDYAGTLLQEARAMYEADVAAGKTGDELHARLKENIECASQLYTYRAALEGTAAAGLLDELLTDASAGDAAFAQDLRGVMERCESLILNP